MKKLGLTAALAILLVSATAQAAGPDRVQEGAWPDKGATILLSPQPQTGLVWVGVIAKTGAASVPADKEGLAYFTAKMLQRGTTTRSRKEIADAIDFLGASLDVDVRQGSIWLSGEVLSRNLDAYLKIMADVVLNPAFSEDEIERLRGEILGELEIEREGDRGLAQSFFERTIYEGSPYGKFVKGTPKGIKAITKDDLVGFYQAQFVGSNLLFAAAGDVGSTVGDVGSSTFDKQIRTHFAGLKKGTPPPQPALKTQPAQGIRVLLVDKPDRTQNQIFLGHAAIAPSAPDYYPYLVANNAFGGMFISRLMKEVRVKRGWSYGAHSRVAPDLGQGVFWIWTFPANDDTLPTIKLVLDLYADYKARGISDEELKSARSNLSNRFAFRLETAQKRLFEHIQASLLHFPKGYLAEYQKSVSGVTLDQANAAAQKHSDPSNLVLVMVCSADKFAKDIAKIPGVARVDVIPFDAENPETARKSITLDKPQR